MLRNTKSRGLRPSALQKTAFVLTGQENDNIPTSALQDLRGGVRKILPFACQGRLCCRCEHASIRGAFPVSESIYCRFRHEVVKADSKPFYCPQYRVVRKVAA